MLRSARSRALASGDSSPPARRWPRGRPPAGYARVRSLSSMSSMFSGRNGARSGSSSRRRHAQPLEEVAGGAVQDRAGLRVGTRVLDEPAQHQRPDHAVAVDAAHRRYPGPADRLPVGDDGQGLERRLGEPDLLAVPDEPLDERRAVLPSIEAPAARDLPQVEAAAVGRVLRRQGAQARRRPRAAGRSSTWASSTSGTGSSATSRIASSEARRPGRRRAVAVVTRRLRRRRLRVGRLRGLVRVVAAELPPVKSLVICSLLLRFPLRCRVAPLPAPGGASRTSRSPPVQVTYSSPSGVTCSNATTSSRYSSSSARNDATIS